LRLAPERYDAVREQLLSDRLVKKYACRGGGLRLSRRGKKLVREMVMPPLDEVEDISVSTGTGFFVSANGHVLTNAHVVEDLVEGRLIRVSAEGKSSVAYIVARDGPNDLALLKIDRRSRFLPVFKRGVRVAENIATFGFPLIDYLDSEGSFTSALLAP
jgi:S1-C subfamily serine protease